jgi:hypothetical protein
VGQLDVQEVDGRAFVGLDAVDEVPHVRELVGR